MNSPRKDSMSPKNNSAANHATPAQTTGEQSLPGPERTEATQTGPAQAGRRGFLKTSALVAGGMAAVGQGSIARAANAFGSDLIKIGLVGSGGRGRGATIQALNTTGGGVKLVAMADVFPNQIEGSLEQINEQHADKVDVADTRFVGCEAYKQVLDTDCDLVILATPPGFRPLHFEAAVNAGKHVFMEKPVAADAPGVRRVIEANKIAKEKGLGVQVGLQRRHEFRYNETMDRLKDGAIGDIILARAYWNGAGVWIRSRKPEQSELEYQMRNWYYFNWLCGDHICEQHIHNLDVINWLADDYPVEAQAVGGREVRNGENTGQIFDHHMVEYTYANGMKMLSQCRHIIDCWNSVSEFAHGTKGTCEISRARIFDNAGKQTWKSEAKEVKGKGWQQEHYDFFSALRDGEVPNEAEYGAYSTMTAILGRMASYSGKIVKWDKALAEGKALADYDNIKSFDDVAPVQKDDDGKYPVPVPGQYSPFAV